MPEKIPCPVDGCDEVFADEAEAMAHMKDKHKDKFSAPVPKMPPVDPEEPGEPEIQKNPDDQKDLDALAMVPPGMLKVLDERVEKIVEARIEAALEAYLPQVQEAVAGAMKRVVDAKTKELTGGGGVIPGSPVTPVGAALLEWIKGGSGGGSDLDSFIKQANQFKAIGELFNPPASLTERIMQTAYIKSLKNVGLVTDKQMKDV